MLYLKTLFRVAISIMLLSLVACGGGGGGGGGDSSTQTNDSSSETSEYQKTLEDAGYLCFSDGHCEKFVKTSSFFSGSHTTCIVSTSRCTSESLLDYINRKIKSAENTFETNVPSYKGSTFRECKYMVGNNVGCSYMQTNGDLFLYAANVSVQSTSVTLTYSFYGVDSSALTSKSSSLETSNSLSSYYAPLPVKPTNYQSTITEIDTLFDNTTAEDWGDDGSSTYKSNYKKARSPICASVDDFSYSCSYITKQSEYHECKYWYGLSSDQECNVYTSLPPLTLQAFKNNLNFMGFDSASTYGASFSSTYPAAVLDTGCEAIHNFTKDRIVSLMFKPNTTDVYEISTSDPEGNKNLVRFNGESWANIGDENEHCIEVTGILSGVSGAYVKILSNGQATPKDYTNFVSYIDTNGIKLVNASWGNNTTFPTATTDLINSSHFFVVAAGNASTDWTSGKTSNPNSKYIWGTSDQNYAIYVGNINRDYTLHSNSAYPGSDTNIQSRWIVALGDNVITSGTTALTTDGMVTTSGTSFSAPYVTRALNLGKNLCPGSSYEDLSNTILSTANRSFTGYDVTKFGQGLLDVKAFLSSLSSSCP